VYIHHRLHGGTYLPACVYTHALHHRLHGLHRIAYHLHHTATRLGFLVLLRSADTGGNVASPTPHGAATVLAAFALVIEAHLFGEVITFHGKHEGPDGELHAGEAFDQPAQRHDNAGGARRFLNLLPGAGVRAGSAAKGEPAITSAFEFAVVEFGNGHLRHFYRLLMI